MTEKTLNPGGHLLECAKCIRELPKAAFTKAQTRKSGDTRLCQEGSGGISVGVPNRAAEGSCSSSSDPTSDRVEIRQSSTYGRVLHSLVPVARGQEVFIERPILISLNDTTAAEDSLLHRVSEKTGLNLIDDFIFVKSFCLSDVATRSSVLDCYTPPVLSVAESKLLSALLKVVDVCKVYKWSADVPVETLRQVVLIRACNAHGFYSQNSTAAALYTFGSKMRHSCCPNVVYTSQRRDGYGCFVAKRDIQAGEELFISYIDTCKSEPMRNHDLVENYLFRCQCEMCVSGTDRFRGMKCGAACQGTLYRNQGTGVWTCDVCHRTCSDSDTPVSIADERKLVDETLAFIQSMQANIPGQLREEMAKLTAGLGPNHAATKMLEKEYIQRVLLTREMRPDVLQELKLYTDSILVWSNDSPDFLDSSLVEIGCAVGRAGDFESGKRYLEIVKDDMDLLFGKDSKNEQMHLVTRGLAGCTKRKKELIPDLSSSSDSNAAPQCPVQ